MKLDISKEELETMSYDDVAYIILKTKKKKMKIQDLFKLVIKSMELPEKSFEDHIADFFGLLSTDQRFVMLEKGYWDLKENHKAEVVIDDDDEEIEEEIKENTEEDTEGDTEETINYDDELIDDDETEDDLKDLVVIDDDTEETDNL